MLAGTSLGAAAIAIAAALIFGAASSSPAFAVSRNHDGTYTVQIRSWSAISAANRALHGMNLQTVVVPITTVCGRGTLRPDLARCLPPAARRSARSLRLARRRGSIRAGSRPGRRS